MIIIFFEGFKTYQIDDDQYFYNWKSPHSFNISENCLKRNKEEAMLMLDMTNKVLTLLCISLLVGSIFFAVGDVSSTENDVLNKEKIVLLETEDHINKDRLKSFDLQILDSYGTHTLAKIEPEEMDSLKRSRFDVNELPSRTEISVNGHTFDIFDSEPDISTELKRDGYEKGNEGPYLVHMLGPINPEWRNSLEEEGVNILNYVPNYAYAVTMTPETAQKVKSLDFVDWVDFYHPGYKMDEGVNEGKLTIDFVSTPSKKGMRSLKEMDPSFDLFDKKEGGRAVMEVRSQDQIEELAKMKDVYHISNIDERELKMEVDSQIIGGGAWIMDDDDDPTTAYRKHGDNGAYINQLGYTGKDVTVAIADSGLGDGTKGSAGHPDFEGRVVGGYTWDTNGWEDGHGHGTHAAGSIAGDSYSGTGVQYKGLDGNYSASQGLAYDSELYSLRVFDSGGNWAGPSNDYEIVEAAAQNSDSYVHSNSWGEDTGDGKYEASDEDYDKAVRDADSSKSGNQPMVITVAAGNAGSSQTIASPGNAKNVITVGSTESYVPNGSSYGYGNFDNPDYISDFSSRGWTEDNRVKPDVAAPGSGILSTSTPLNDPEYPYSEDDQYEWMKGTSMANPSVAGAASTVVEWYETNHGEKPSPAMVKSLLINTAHDLNDSNGNTDPIPNPEEGWGMVDLSKLEYPKSDPVPFMLKDQNTTLQTGEEKTYKLLREKKGEPLKLTLHWSDEEGSGLINDLRLKVTSPSGKVYKGNAFTNGWSQAGQDAIKVFDDSGDGWDDTNNVRNVYIAPEEVETGVYTVEVEGANVPADANNDGEANQDFALVGYNAAKGFIDSPVGDESFNSSNVTVEWSTKPTYSYNISLDGGDWIDVGTNESYTFHDLSNGEHIVKVKRKNSTNEKIDSVEFLVDRETPDVEITFPEEGSIFNLTDITVRWNGSDGISGMDHYEIRLASGEWMNVSNETKYTFEGLDQGEHTVFVRAVDVAGNSFNESVNFILDTDPPDLEINSPMYGEIFGTETVNLEWSSSSEDIDHYEVELDGNSKYTGMGQTITLEGLTDGEHQVNIKAVDIAGNINNESTNFIVDTENPEVEIVSIDEGQIFGDENITISWQGSDQTSGINYYEIRKDENYWEYVGMKTEITYSELSEGSHTVEVRTADGAGNNATDMTSFEVDKTSPEVEITNINDTQIFDTDEVTLKWSGDDETSGIDNYKIRLNGNEWVEPNEERKTFENLSDGVQLAELRAEDKVGNTKITSVNFTVDTTSPTIQIIKPERDSLIGEHIVELDWTGQDSLSGINHYEIRLGEQNWKEVPNLTSYEFTDLEDGDWKVSVRAVDRAGNKVIENITFEIDHTPPVIQITNPKESATLEKKSVNVTWQGYDEATNIKHYEIRVDGGEWINIGSRTYYKFEDLSYEEHDIEVKGIDHAGNSETNRITIELKESDNSTPGYSLPVIVIGSLTSLVIYLGKPWLFDIEKENKD